MIRLHVKTSMSIQSYIKYGLFPLLEVYRNYVLTSVATFLQCPELLHIQSTSTYRIPARPLQHVFPVICVVDVVGIFGF